MVKWRELLCFVCFNVTIVFGIKFEPNWNSLDNRTLPQWYDDAKIGIFLHWGVYSVPSFGSEWFWSNWKGNTSGTAAIFMKRNYPPDFTYQEFAKEFTAEFFNATEWAELFKKSGAKYIVLTSKHHEGYAMWPSKYSYSWNSLDIGPRRDIVGELGEAVRKEDLIFGLYHSLYEWFNPIYLSDKSSNWTKKEFVYNKILPEMHELIENYRPAVLWSDGEWEAPYEYWNATEFLAWLFNESPVKEYIVTNDRWGSGTLCKHGDFYTCTDRYNPGTLQPHKWENAMTIDKTTWGYKRNAKLSQIYTIEELLEELVTTISCGGCGNKSCSCQKQNICCIGSCFCMAQKSCKNKLNKTHIAPVIDDDEDTEGNLLMNVGPTKEGTIIPIFQERLLQVGYWLSINGEGIYGTKPWTSQNDTLTKGVWYTSKRSNVYATVLKWPVNSTVALGSAKDLFENSKTNVILLGNEDNGVLRWFMDNGIIKINLPDLATVKSKWAYVLKIYKVEKI